MALRREADRAGAAWVTDLFAGIKADGFRLARPHPTREGDGIAPGSWSARTFLEGRAASGDDLARVVSAIDAFHAALAGVPYGEGLRSGGFDDLDRYEPAVAIVHA